MIFLFAVLKNTRTFPCPLILNKAQEHQISLHHPDLVYRLAWMIPLFEEYPDSEALIPANNLLASAQLILGVF